MKVFRLARRNVWRNRRRTVVTVGAMSLSLFILVLYAGLMEGYLRDMERGVLDYEVGDVQVYPLGYRDNPSLWTRIEDPDALLVPLRQAGFRATGRLLAFGLAAAGDSSAGASFRGIDVERDATVSLVHEQLLAGRWLSPDDDRAVVLGRRLARMLDVAPGGEVLIFSQGADGSLAYDLYQVRGVLRGVGDATDRTGVFMTARAFRQLMVVEKGVHQILVRRPQELPLDEAAARIRGRAGALDVKTWRELLPTVASMVDSARGMVAMMYVIVYLAVAILILNAMLMAVFERIREIGVLKAVGVSPLDVVRMILLESGIQAAIAMALGVGLALPCLLYLVRFGIDMGSLAGISVLGIAMNPIWRAEITGAVLAGPVATLFVMVLLASLYPSLKAAAIDPVEAMHHR